MARVDVRSLAGTAFGVTRRTALAAMSAVPYSPNMARQRRVSLPLDQLTDRQLHLHHIRLLDEQNAILKSLENRMADLQQSVSDLQAAVDAVAARVAGRVQVLTDALAAANQALADEALDDASREEQLATALEAAQSAADAISAEANELNSIGAEPEVPVEPTPEEELPPVEDLPTEQPTEETPA